MQTSPIAQPAPNGPIEAPLAAADSGPLPHESCPRRVLLSLLERHAQHHPLNEALSVLRHGRWHAISYLDLARRVRRLSAGLGARFPQGGIPMAVLAEPGPAWGVTALGILASGNVLVPLDTSAQPDELTRLLRAARPALLFTSSAYRDKAAPLPSARILNIQQILDTQDLRDLDTHEPCHRGSGSSGAGESVGVQDSGEIMGVQNSGAAVMAFTSGTTGAPKAVEIGFGSLLFQVEALTRCFALRPSDRLLSLLPLHHMLELTAGFLCPLWRGAQIAYLQTLAPSDALREIRARGITRIVTVPAWLSLLKRELQHRSAAETRARKKSAERESSAWTKARAAFGPDFEHFVCGGAPLPHDVAAYFDALGAPVLEGYGLTETSPVVATNTAARRRRGSVGIPLAGTEMRVEAEGEVLVRGPHVATRYRAGDGAGQAIVDADGWFHTGDLGHLDGDGFLYVTGRAKSTIVLASGKNVQPEEVEACLLTRGELADAGVVGLAASRPGGGESVCAVVVPSREHDDIRRLAKEDVEAVLRRLVAEATGGLARFKRPKTVLVREEPLPRTSTGKLRRAELARWAKGARKGAA